VFILGPEYVLKHFRFNEKFTKLLVTQQPGKLKNKDEFGSLKILRFFVE
jgi:hypothetical protein